MKYAMDGYVFTLDDIMKFNVHEQPQLSNSEIVEIVKLRVGEIFVNGGCDIERLPDNYSKTTVEYENGRAIL